MGRAWAFCAAGDQHNFILQLQVHYARARGGPPLAAKHLASTE